MGTQTVSSQPSRLILSQQRVTHCTGYIKKASLEMTRRMRQRLEKTAEDKLGGVGGTSGKKKHKMTRWIEGAPDRQRSEIVGVTASPMTSEWFIRPHASVHQTIRSHLNQATQRAAARAQPQLISHDLKSRPSGRRDGGRPTSSVALLSSSECTAPSEEQTFKVLPLSFGQKNDQNLCSGEHQSVLAQSDWVKPED